MIFYKCKYDNTFVPMKLDILAIGAHPDDVELSCSGVLLMEKLAGKKIGVADLTQGELGTRGTIETRYEEAAIASTILQLDVRENLKMADGFFANDQAHQLQIVELIRKYKPEIILANAPSDRHPDHGRSALLIRDSAWLSGLRKIETLDNTTGENQEAWRPKYVFNYLQDKYLTPDFIMDITPVMESKIACIKAYKTQFASSSNKEPQTYISTPEFLDSIIYRAKMLGKMIGVQYGEGFISEKMVGIKSFDSIIQNVT